MSSLSKQASMVVEHLPIRPSKGNVMDHIHHKVLRGESAPRCREVVQYLIESGRVRFEGSPKRPTALLAK